MYDSQCALGSSAGMKDVNQTINLALLSGSVGESIVLYTKNVAASIPRQGTHLGCAFDP